MTPEEPEAALGSGPQIAVSEASLTDGPQLEILFVGESWAEITSDTGELLYYDLGRTGSRARVPADSGLNLFFGNVAGVELSIEGQPVSIPASVRRGELAQFDLDALVDIADLVNSVDAVGGVGQVQ